MFCTKNPFCKKTSTSVLVDATAFVWFILFCSKFRSTTSDEPNNQQTEGPLEINHIPELKKISTFIEKRTHNMHNVASNFGALNGAS